MADAPGYLGRVLDRDGVRVGTCFQVAPGALAASVCGMVRAAAVRSHAPVTITGVPDFVDEHSFRFTHATGHWLGTAAREDGVARGQVEACGG